MHRTLIAALALTITSSCAHEFEEDPRVGPSEATRNAMGQGDSGDIVMVGSNKLWRERWEDDLNTIRSKAAFELDCAGGSLSFQVLEMMTGLGHDDWAKSVGVTGCGSRAVYVRHVDRTSMTWLIESKTLGATPEKKPQPVRSPPAQGEQPTTL